MKSLSFSILLGLSAFASSGQTFTPAASEPPICLTVAQAAAARDSLTRLPLVRREARAWQAAASSYRGAADSLHVALAMSESRRINQEAVTQVWRQRARRRGLLVWGGVVAAGGVGYLLITR